MFYLIYCIVGCLQLVDPEFDHALKVGTDLKQSFRNLLSSQKTTLANLRKMKPGVFMLSFPCLVSKLFRLHNYIS